MPPQSKARSHLMLQAVGLMYVAYILFQLVTSYMRGEWNIQPRLFVLVIAVMTTAEIVAAFFSIRAWKRDRKKELEDEKNAEENASE